MPAQDPDSGGMERADPDALGAEADNLVYPLPHLSRCLIGKSDSHDIPWVHLFLFYQVRNPVGQNPGLARSCSRQYEKRTFRMIYRFLLHRIE